MTPTQPQKNKKILLSFLVLLLFFGAGAFVLSNGNKNNVNSTVFAKTILTRFGKTHFRAYGRNFSVPQDGLRVICVKDLDLKKVSPGINDLDKIMPTIVEICSDNFNAQLYYGNGEVYDMQGRSNSKFKPGEKYLIVLLQYIGNRGGQTNEPLLEYTLEQGEKSEVSLTIYNIKNNFEKVYDEDLGKIIALRDIWWEDPIQFKDVDKDGNLDLRIRYPFESSLGYMTIFQKTDSSLSVWKHSAPNHHASFSIRDDVIYQGDEPIVGVDPKSFVIFNWSYAKDKNRVYGDGGPFDVATFVALDSDGDYVKDKNGVYFEGYSTWAGLRGNEKIEGADPETFQYIAGRYSKDKNHVYEFIWPIENGPDPETLILIEDSITHSINWMKDKDNVYYDMNIVQATDPATFVVMNYIWGRDGEKLFYDGKFVENGDPDTLKLITPEDEMPNFLTDKNQVYFHGWSSATSPVIVGADRSTFRVLEESYSRDKDHVFYETRVIPEADPNTFVNLMNDTTDWPRYAKDKNHVYMDEKIIPDADPVTFIIPNNQ